MNEIWLTVAVCGVATIGLKAVGPGVMGGRPLPPRAASVVELMAPALLAALIATNTFGSDRELVIDERLAGVAAAGAAIALRAPVLLVVVIAATVTAVLRALG